MKRVNKTLSLILLAVMSTLTLVAQDYRSFPVDKMTFNSTGVYYSLPKTELIFKVKVEKIQENKGVFADYAYMIGAKNTIINDAVKYRIKDIEITSRPIGDSEQIYFLQTTNKMKISKTEAGTLLSIGEVEDKPCHKPHTHKPQKELALKTTTTTIETNPIYEHKLLSQNKLEAMPGLTAEQAIKAIKELREKQLDVLLGSVDGTFMNNSIEYMYKQLDKMIDGYVALFTGEAATEELEYTFTLAPEKPLIVEEDLVLGIFKFSEEEGVLSLNHKTDAPIVAVRIHSLNTTKEYEKIEEQKKKDDRLQRQISKNGVGLYYRIPEMAELSIDFAGKRYFATTHISQFGVVSYMMDSPSKITFKPKTGALKTIE
jgi:hypothetical protein